MNKAQVELEAS